MQKEKKRKKTTSKDETFLEGKRPGYLLRDDVASIRDVQEQHGTEWADWLHANAAQEPRDKSEARWNDFEWNEW